MKALLLRDVGKINVEEVATPEIKDGEVLVKVGACGICGSDIPRAYKDGAHNMPLIIGHEFSGTVEAVSNSVDNSWVGKKVGVFPLIPCRKCECCKNRKYEMCKNYSYLGSRQDGGFAEYVAVPEWNMIELPSVVGLDQAAMLEPMAVAVHAIRQVVDDSIDKDHAKVVVMGLGTIGLFVTIFLLDMGFKNVYTVGNKEFQKNKVLELGIDEANYCDGKKENVAEWIGKKTDGHGCDVFFECIGTTNSLVTGIDAASPSGAVCTVGNPHSDMPIDRTVYWKILRNQLTLKGTWNSSFTHEDNDDWHYVIERLQQGKIKPEAVVTHRFDLDDILTGFEIMRDKKEEYAKILACF